MKMTMVPEALIAAKIGSGYSIKKVNETSTHLIFVAENLNKEMIPGGMVVAFNKSTKSIGISIWSEDEAIKSAT